jgi:hypothetical protein
MENLIYKNCKPYTMVFTAHFFMCNFKRVLSMKESSLSVFLFWVLVEIPQAVHDPAPTMRS